MPVDSGLAEKMLEVQQRERAERNFNKQFVMDYDKRAQEAELLEARSGGSRGLGAERGPLSQQRPSDRLFYRCCFVFETDVRLLLTLIGEEGVDVVVVVEEEDRSAATIGPTTVGPTTVVAAVVVAQAAVAEENTEELGHTSTRNEFNADQHPMSYLTVQ